MNEIRWFWKVLESGEKREHSIKIWPLPSCGQSQKVAEDGTYLPPRSDAVRVWKTLCKVMNLQGLSITFINIFSIGVTANIAAAKRDQLYSAYSRSLFLPPPSHLGRYIGEAHNSTHADSITRASEEGAVSRQGATSADVETLSTLHVGHKKNAIQTQARGFQTQREREISRPT